MPREAIFDFRRELIDTDHTLTKRNRIDKTRCRVIGRGSLYPRLFHKKRHTRKYHKGGFYTMQEHDYIILGDSDKSYLWEIQDIKYSRYSRKEFFGIIEMIGPWYDEDAFDDIRSIHDQHQAPPPEEHHLLDEKNTRQNIESWKDYQVVIDHKEDIVGFSFGKDRKGQGGCLLWMIAAFISTITIHMIIYLQL